MARQQRRRSETDCYHIIMRGNNKSYIFDKQIYKNYFIECIKTLEKEKEFEIMAWCLMDNHVHLVLKVEPERIETAFKRLNVKYAMYYHRINKSVGHVFQDRFKSEPIESDESLMNVIRYVHNNPVKAKIVEEAKSYKWSSYSTYLKNPSTESMKFVWRLFNQSVHEFREFHKIEDGQEYLEIKEDQEQFRQEKAQKAITAVYNKYGVIDSEEIFQRRDIFEEVITEIVRDSGLSGRKIAKLMGVSESRIRRMKRRK